MRINEGDILVCKPGYWGHEDNPAKSDNVRPKENPTYGGAGYIDGLMQKASSSYNGEDPFDLHVFWKFHNEAGVFSRAVRLANEEEKKAYKEGIRNAKDIQRTTFKISYVSIDGENKNVEVEAFYETAAVSSIKDLKRVNYVISG